MRMKDSPVFDAPAANTAFVAVSLEHSFSQRSDAITFALLVVYPLRNGFAFLNGLEHLGIELPHLQYDPLNGRNLRIARNNGYMAFRLVLE